PSGTSFEAPAGATVGSPGFQSRARCNPLATYAPRADQSGGASCLRDRPVHIETALTVLRPSAGALRAGLPGLPRATHRVALRALMLSFGRLVEVERAERIVEAPEPAIFALNHNNAFEAVIVPATLIRLRGGRRVHFLADWMYLHLPALGWLMRES